MGNQQALTWNYENRLSSVTSSSVTESYDYDVDGQRIRKLSNGVYTFYPNQYYEATTGSTIKYYYFGNQRIAQRNNSTLYYLHQDHLGSTVLTTDNNATQRYDAYGELRSYTGSFSTRYQYTGQYVDDTGLYNYHARYYDRLIGSFLSPDTLVPDPGNVQSYNRYLYGLGNPIKYNDPSGHCPICIIAALLGIAGIIHSDSTNTTYVPTQADIATSQLSGVFLLSGIGGVAAFGTSATTQAVVIGAGANASASATVQVVKNQKVNPVETGIAAGYGAVGGVSASLPGYWGYVVSTAAGAGQQVTTDYVVNQQKASEVININTAIAAGLGLAGSVAQGPMPSNIKYNLSEDSVLFLETLPMEYAPKFTGGNAAELTQRQLAYVASVRYASGYFISSLPISVAPSDQFIEPVRGPR